MQIVGQDSMLELPASLGLVDARMSGKKIAGHAYLTGTKAITDQQNAAIHCPRCDSANTTETSHFGSTSCKALYRCLDCMEPFDYFKPY